MVVALRKLALAVVLAIGLGLGAPWVGNTAAIDSYGYDAHAGFVVVPQVALTVGSTATTPATVALIGRPSLPTASRSSTSSLDRFLAAKGKSRFGALLRRVHADETGSVGLGRAPEFAGGRLTEDQALDTAARYLGEGYREVSPGRFVSANGSRVVRYGSHEVRSRVHHIHFEAVENGRVVENTRAEIVP